MKKALTDFIIHHKKTIILLIVGIIAILLVSMLALLGIRIDFLIGDELNIVLSPLDKSIITEYNKKENITFRFENDNNLLCKSECSYQFIDIRNHTLIDQASLTLKSRSKVEKSYIVSPATYGSGQAIYLFEVSCHNIATLLCRTDEDPRLESSFITLSYDLSAEEKNRLSALNMALNNLLSRLNQLDITYQKLRYAFSVAAEDLKRTLFNNNASVLEPSILILGQELNSLINSSNYLVRLWNINQYGLITSALPDINKTSNQYAIDLAQDEAMLNSLIGSHNSFISRFAELIDRSSVIDSMISYFRQKSPVFEQAALDYRNNLTATYSLFYNPNFTGIIKLTKRIDALFSDLDFLISLTNKTSLTNLDISGEFNLSLIDIGFVNKTFYSNITTNLKIQEPVCCVLGKCRTCCSLYSCRDDPRLYPVIFLHGHSFSKDTSAEASLNSFAKMQRKLTQDGIINAGKIDLLNLDSIPPGEYGRSGNPVSIRASYYYIHYYDLGSYKLTTQKSEKIENYALRLDEIIDIVKDRTGSDKVNIVAHSMGGLVARYYIRIFGEDSVNKLVMIATPNAGISDNSKRLCNFLGSKDECSDIVAGSIFMKRLNSMPKPKTSRFYTIAGIGCYTDGMQGDGVVSYRSAFLSYSEKFNVSGICSGIFQTNLHNNILDPDKYPAVYNITRNILKAGLS